MHNYIGNIISNTKKNWLSIILNKSMKINNNNNKSINIFKFQEKRSNNFKVLIKKLNSSLYHLENVLNCFIKDMNLFNKNKLSKYNLKYLKLKLIKFKN
jgi:hypothetical protein